MSHRGRHYYDPITQPPISETERRDLSRIEVFQDPADPSLQRWCARLVNPDGSIGSDDMCDTSNETVIRLAQQKWPGLEVFELQEPGEDSTWEGMGPSPRLWQADPMRQPLPQNLQDEFADRMREAPTVPEPTQDQIPIRALVAPEPGMYVALADVLNLLETWAVAYDMDKNPSGAMALRDAVDAFKEIG